MNRSLYVLSVCVATILLFSGCATAPYSFTPAPDVQPQETIDPPLGKEVTRNIGDAVASKGLKTATKSLTISAPVQFGVDATQTGSLMGGCVPSALPQTVPKVASYTGPKGDSSCFGPIVFLRTEQDGDQGLLTCTGNFFTNYVCQDLQGNFFVPWANSDYNLLRDKDRLKVTDSLIEDGPNILQELIYNGRTGDTLKFIYREFSNEMIRPAFTQDVQYDLSQSAIVGFKDLRLEVISATNTSVTFKVMQSF